MAQATHADDPRQQYERERERLEQGHEAGDYGTATYDAICEVLDALDGTKRRPVFDHGGERTTLSSNSLTAYCQRLRMLATEAGDLLACTNEDIDTLMDALADGSAGIGPEDGYALGTMGQFESAALAFYRYHDGHDVDAEAITVTAPPKRSKDHRDMWTVEEVQAMRKVIDSKRDEALFELLAYTGQRVRIIQTLRVKDVDPDFGDTGRYYVNDEVEGRKRRDGHGPLLGARGAVKRWLAVHPTGDPDDALITCTERVKYGPDPDDVTRPGDRLGSRTIAQALERIKERAGVEKGVHPHMFRHYFTTIALTPKSRGGFGMNLLTVKRLRGDALGSNTVETTYAHLVDEDASVDAEEDFTGKEPENALTPAAPCSVCGEMLNAGDKACNNCGAKRDPTAEKSEVEELHERIEALEAKEQIESAIVDSYAELDPRVDDAAEQKADLDVLRGVVREELAGLLDDPERLQRAHRDEE